MPPSEIGIDVLEFRLSLKDNLQKDLALATKGLLGFKGAATNTARAVTSAAGGMARSVALVGKAITKVPFLGGVMGGIGKAGKWMNKPFHELGAVGGAARVGLAMGVKSMIEEVLAIDRVTYDAIKVGFKADEAKAAILKLLDGVDLQKLRYNVDKTQATLFHLAKNGIGAVEESAEKTLEVSAELATTIGLMDRGFDGSIDTATAFALQMHMLGVSVKDNKQLMMGAANAANTMHMQYDKLLAPISGMSDFLLSIDKQARSGAVKDLISTGGLFSAVMGDPQEVISLYERVRRLDADGGMKAFLGSGGFGGGQVRQMLAKNDIKGVIEALVKTAGGKNAAQVEMFRTVPGETEKAFDMSQKTFFILRAAAEKLSKLGEMTKAQSGGFDEAKAMRRQKALDKTLTGSIVLLSDAIKPMLKELAMKIGPYLQWIPKALAGVIDFFKDPAGIIAGGIRKFWDWLQSGGKSVGNWFDNWMAGAEKGLDQMLRDPIKGLKNSLENLTSAEWWKKTLGGSATGHLVTSPGMRRVAETQPELILPLERVAPFLRSMESGTSQSQSNPISDAFLDEIRRLRQAVQDLRNDPFRQDTHGRSY